jgi:two-component system, NtrC family, response regulator HydG
MTLQDTNRYWKEVVDTIQDGVMLVDTEGTILSVNRAFEEITGFARAEIVGKPCTVLNCSSCAKARNEKTCHCCSMFDKGHLRKQKCKLVRKDGRVIDIVKNASVLKDASGRVTGAVETMTDITDLIEKEHEIESYRRELAAEDRFHGMIGRSAAMQQLFDLVRNAARSDAPVIVYGESGTGKEMVSRAIHDEGLRRGGPFIKVNCAALNESLLESELFGHVKGAFTGAFREREGRFEAAHTGDIFLDEVGDLPLSTQIKLLRVLEEKVIERVGDHRPIPVDVRIITATNRDLQELVSRGAFREDLFYRINVIPIRVPPLRRRLEDIPLLAESFFRRIRLKSGKPIEGISQAALELLACYAWPGNVRELRSAFEFAFVSCTGAAIEPQHFPHHVSNPEERACTPPPAADNLEEIKRQRLVNALRQSRGNQSETAKILGISRTSVWSQIKRFGLDPKGFAPDR